jgi:hypothetical protein
VQIRTKKHFNEILTKLTLEIVEEEDLDETTGTGNVAGYNTPFAFDPEGDKKKKKYKKKTKKVNETIDQKDLKVITKLIKDVVGDILRDIWLKRSTWK